MATDPGNAHESDDEELEYTLLNKRDAKVYQVPPAASAAGHRASDWKEAIWKGNLRVIGRGKTLIIKLLTPGTEELFAQCLVPNGEHEKYCERVVDSSRYWVLQVAHGKRHAFLGFGFSDRNDAFDFNCCLSDFKSTFVDRHSASATEISGPMKDLSLKEGQTIKVNIPGMEGGGSRRPPQPAVANVGGPISLLAPPPPPAAGSLAKSPPDPAVCSTTPPTSAPDDDDFGDFADFQSAAAQQANAGS